MHALSSCLGFPRIGAARELKRALEATWRGESEERELRRVAQQLRLTHWMQMQERGIDHIPCNDFSLYDHVLDMAVTVGAVPARYEVIPDALERYFAMARGYQDAEAGVDLAALEMTKWFDTNYHYIVPELSGEQTFELDPTKLLREVDQALEAGVTPRPVLVGPVSFLLLSKLAEDAPSDAHTLDLLDDMLAAYERLLGILAERGVEWVQLDEPFLVFDLDDRMRAAYRDALPELAANPERPNILLTTYFDTLGDNLELATGSGLDGLHIDLVRAPDQLIDTLRALPEHMVLSLGVVDGRNIWRTHLDAAHQQVRRAVTRLGADRVIVAPSCSLLHVPVDLDQEDGLDQDLAEWMAFALQKLEEIRALAAASTQVIPTPEIFGDTREALARRQASEHTTRAQVRERVEGVGAQMLERAAPYTERRSAQSARLGLPLFPTTTIGSFPQTREVRSMRSKWRRGTISTTAYEDFLEREIETCLERQMDIGLDVLVHGEFERNDMVEYFGERLDGFTFTTHGWVQSYGSRCVKPPILYGDVVRPEPMTTRWSVYAQSLTSRPVKGMLTGPVTILQWSFVRDDQPRAHTCQQIALALRDEIADLERDGISIVQVDEPAMREGLPLRRADWEAYLRWAVDAFRLATAGARDTTQVHTHMCYADFGDILSSIVEMDADVISIETSRSNMELLRDFKRFDYPNEVGPGVYDIHSPRIPAHEEMVALLEHAAQVLDVSRIWVNPDCGLKTRQWAQVEPALRGMVVAAHHMREMHRE